MSSSIKTLEHLFISKVRIKTLEYFLLNPTESIHLRGAVREFNEEINAVRRELTRLEELKLVTVEDKGNRKYFTLNLDHQFIPELTSLFHKSYGLGAEIINNKSKLGNVTFAFLTPYFTRDFAFGQNLIDLVIIGKVDLPTLERLVSKAQEKRKREIHYTVMSESEFQTRKRRGDSFILDLLIQDNCMLIGNVSNLIQ